MYCNNCGKDVNENAVVCLHCGASVNNQNINNDSGGFLWGLLGCCIPLVGLVLYLVWRDQKPKTARAAGIGALVSVLFGGFIYIMIILAGMGSAMVGF